MKVGIAVSGTGGHIYPGISIAQLFKKNGYSILFFCNSSEMSESILKSYDFDFYKIKITGWQNRSIVSLFIFFILFFNAFIKSMYLIRKNRLDVVIGMGGYLSIPVILAAMVLGRKTIIQEQNFSPGLANKFLHIFANKTAIGFLESKQYFKFKNKVFFTGNPIRNEFYDIVDINKAKSYFNIACNQKVVFIFGGSQGANFLNKTLIESFNDNDNRFFIHITGNNDFDLTKNIYKNKNIKSLVVKYMSDIYMAYFASDLVISRAGASTLTEIIVSKKPSILVPYPYASDNHQFKNALFLEKYYLAKIHEEKTFNQIKFIEDVNYLLNYKDEYLSQGNNIYSDIHFDENFYKLMKFD